MRSAYSSQDHSLQNNRDQDDDRSPQSAPIFSVPSQSNDDINKHAYNPRSQNKGQSDVPKDIANTQRQLSAISVSQPATGVHTRKMIEMSEVESPEQLMTSASHKVSPTWSNSPRHFTASHSTLKQGSDYGNNKQPDFIRSNDEPLHISTYDAPSNMKPNTLIKFQADESNRTDSLLNFAAATIVRKIQQPSTTQSDFKDDFPSHQDSATTKKIIFPNGDFHDIDTPTAVSDETKEELGAIPTQNTIPPFRNATLMDTLQSNLNITHTKAQTSIEQAIREIQSKPTELITAVTKSTVVKKIENEQRKPSDNIKDDEIKDDFPSYEDLADRQIQLLSDITEFPSEPFPANHFLWRRSHTMVYIWVDDEGLVRKQLKDVLNHEKETIQSNSMYF